MPCSGLITIFVVLCLFRTACPVKCDIGYGQRGLKFQNEILWQRNCKETTYCFEAVTTDINKVVPLIDYPWDPYYSQFYVKSCGGFLGMPEVYHPWVDIPGASEKVLGSLQVNLTFMPTITTRGGTEEFDLRYTCRKDLCSGAMTSFGTLSVGSILLVAVITAAFSTI
mmetsp:Transcript_8145/g.16605  ORF Transcript_8145/g.16605 Transcript_8145/m.16605 type:complete len:168 (+) Transcript_8145:123-626(+)